MIRRGPLFLIRLFLFDGSSARFAFGVVAGVAFSMAVILSTLGIMDGFQRTLERGLKRSVGDAWFTTGGGFFGVPLEELKDFGVESFSPMVQSQGFVASPGFSKGVLIKGVEPQKFKGVSGFNLELGGDKMVIGAALAKEFGLAVGDRLVAVYAAGNLAGGRLPSLHRFVVSGIVEHGIYQKDARQVYVALESIQRALGSGSKVNAVSLNVPNRFGGKVGHFVRDFGVFLGEPWQVFPYWSEYSILFGAVREQKRVITIVLALIVVVSVFNILAFVIFLREKRSREIFLFCALGMGKFQLMLSWLGLVALLWLLAAILSLVFVQVFDLALGHLSIFNLPGDIYHFGRLHLALSWGDYALVFGVVFAWLMGVSWATVWRRRRTSLLSNLRQGFA